MLKETLEKKRTLKWVHSVRPIAYPYALEIMSSKVSQIAAGQAHEFIWFLEHPPILTRGSRSKKEHLLIANRLPIFETDRGGELTYHGPGQRVVYFLLDIRRQTSGDIRAFVRLLENCLIDALYSLGLSSFCNPQSPGVWVQNSISGTSEKIGFIGLRLTRGISSHGISININPDLSHFEMIVPCGLEKSGITSLAKLGITTDFKIVDKALLTSIEKHLGPLEKEEFETFCAKT
ncbi:MAG: lipoyl(octanoyl) transferase LipB [Hyphomicrobium sp.]